jgi:phage-related protein
VAITIPILTDFDGKGIDRAVRKFNQLETTGAKAAHGVRMAAIPAGVALVALGAAAFDAAKAAIADQAAQEKLARTLDKTTKATDAQIAANEDFITATSQATAVADDELRPALARLALGTGDLQKAQEGLKLALDISAATGKPLSAVSDALSKAYGGNTKALAKLDPSMRDLVKSGASVDEIMKKLGDRFGGDASAAANTAEGRMKSLSIAFDETKESVGAALLPAIQAILPVLQKLGKWAQEHPGVFLALAAAVGVVAAAIIGANIAMTLLAMNPVVLTIMAIVAAAALLTVGLVALYKKSETFRDVLKGVWSAVQGYIEVVVDYLKGPVMAAWDIISGAFDAISALIRGDFGAAWEGLKTMIGGVVEWIKTTLLNLPITIAKAALDIGTSIVTGIASGVTGLAQTIWGNITEMPGALLKLAVGWIESLQTIGGKVIDWIVSGVSGLAAAVWEKVSGFADALTTLAGAAKEGLQDLGGAFVGWIKAGVDAAANGIVTALKSVLNGAITVINKGISGINKASGVVNAIIPGGDPIPDIPQIPRLAKGGVVRRPTVALIGEAGPEAIVPLNRAGSMGMGITINVQAGLVSSPDQIGQQIIEAIQSAQRRSGPVFAAA